MLLLLLVLSLAVGRHLCQAHFWGDLILFEDRLSNHDGAHRLTAVVGTCVLASRSHPFKEVLECSFTGVAHSTIPVST